MTSLKTLTTLSEVEQLAQDQTAQYECFLNSLRADIVATKAAGEKVSAPALDRAKAEYNRLAVRVRQWMVTGLYGNFESYLTKMTESDYMVWVGGAEMDYQFAIDRVISANRSTYISALRFGGSFGGLSDLLKNMHGSIGYLVQQKAQEIRWNVRLSDGRTISSLKLLYTTTRHFAYRLYAAKQLLDAGDSIVAIKDENDKVLMMGKANELVKNPQVANLFKYNGRNYIVIQS